MVSGPCRSAMHVFYAVLKCPVGSMMDRALSSDNTLKNSGLHGLNIARKGTLSSNVNSFIKHFCYDLFNPVTAILHTIEGHNNTIRCVNQISAYTAGT